MKRQIALALASSVVLLATTASAQDYYPPPPPPPPRVIPAPPPPVVVQHGERQWDRRFGLGIRTSTQTLASSDNESGTLTLNGMGVQLRWRFSRRWSAEFTMEGTTGGIGDEFSVYKRVSKTGTLTGRYHLTTRSKWDWYLLLGFGASSEEVTYRTIDGSQRTEQLAQSHGHFGTGIERRFGQLGLGAELRFVAASLDDETDMKPAASPIPEDSAGTQFNLALTYYF